MTVRPSWAAVALACVLTALGGQAAGADKSGMDPSKLKLPKGPGSLEGVGENAEPSINMGSVGYGVPISLPAGYQGFAPSLRLSYGSSGGASEVGLGWSLGVPSIERMTARGLPRYDATDVFAADGGDELVRLPGSNLYRSRYEGSFVRYRWADAAGLGKEGYWVAEYPDGKIGYFGADASGTLIANARASGPDGTFSYHLVEMVDVYGHRIRYGYTKDGARPLLVDIGWVFAGGTPRYAVEIAYEDRSDEATGGSAGDSLSDGKPGFDLGLTKRVRSISVTARGQLLRRYDLAYERYEDTGGFTRLASVRTYGTDGTSAYPVVFRFTYTGDATLGCTGPSCATLPYVHTMGSLGVDFATGQADLVDITGDGLPDVVDTTGGQHRFHVANYTAGGGHVFAFPVASATAGAGAAQLASSTVQMLDVNGDGFSDLLDGANKRVLWNDGTGDWRPSGVLDNHLPDLSANANLRFFDYDYDKKPDLIVSNHTTTSYYLNRGDGTYATTATVGEPIGWGFAADGLRMADMNGDGMQDAVLVLAGSISYKMYLGRGRWGAPTELLNLPVGWLPSEVQLIDINGDSLSDAVVVRADRVLFALNRTGRELDAAAEIVNVEGGSIPQKTASVSVRFADMNGSGSTDVVWIDSSGKVTYLELFPVKPNLLAKVSNSIGKMIEVWYGSSVEHMSRDGGVSAWTHRLPHPMLTLDVLETYDTLSGVRQRQEFRFHNGYYDGEERQFRGFADVEVLTTGDDSMEPGRAVYHYDVGDTDPYRKGLLLSQVTESNGAVLSETTSTYGDCSVAEVPANVAPAVRWICQTQTSTVTKEGRPQSEWVTVETQTAYDGYGNATLAAKLGVTAIGGAACGATCEGDEAYEETAFVPPSATGGRWMLRLPYQKRAYGRPGSALYKEERTYYDGDAFVGLPLGQATQGKVSRVTQKVSADSDDTIASAQAQFDSHGNLLQLRDANGHRRTFGYDTDALLLVSEEVWFDDPSRATPYSLTMEVAYHPVLDQVIESTSWMRRESGATTSPRRATTYGYDVFGRLTKIAEPGDTLAAPTREFQYDLAEPVSRIVARQRSVSGGSLDLEEMLCFDGLGRKLQDRTLVKPGLYQASGLARFNVQGKERQSFQPFTSTSSTCDQTAPTGSLSVRTVFDAVARTNQVRQPDATVYGTESFAETEYRPLATWAYDEEDTDSTSAHYGTPTITSTDGLGRTVRIERLLQAGGDPAVTRFTYDELGRLVGIIDPAGNARAVSYDLLDRVTSVDDPDAGLITREYDAAGNLVAETDARGKTTRLSYDEANRVAATWDAVDPDATRVTYRYDANDVCPEPGACMAVEGKIAVVRYPAGEDAFGYDDRGRLVYTGRTLDGLAFSLWTDYDNVGRVVGRHYPDGQALTFALDGAGRQIGVSTYVPLISYDKRGLQDEVQLGNGVVTSYGYDARMRLERLFTIGPASQLHQAYTYTRDRVGNIETITDDRLPDGGATADASYVYDAWYRLVSATLESPGSAWAETLSYSYDLADNILSKRSGAGPVSEEHVGDYVYQGAGPHSVTRAGWVDYAYDLSGNMTLRGQQALEWDYLGRLAQVRRGNRVLARFDYGPDRQRVAKTDGSSRTLYVADDFEIRDGIATTYVKIGTARAVKLESLALAARVLSDVAPLTVDGREAAGDGAITAADAWVAHAAAQSLIGADLGREPSAVDALLAASAKITLLAGQPESRYLHQDQRGTAAVSTDEAGEQIGRAEHYPYGTPRYESGEYLEDYSFTGQERDAQTELSYHSARYLDTRIARWTSPDPLFLGEPTQVLKRPLDGTNLYGYVSNNPVNATDPDGRIAWLLVLPAFEVGVEVAASAGLISAGVAETALAVGSLATVAAILDETMPTTTLAKNESDKTKAPPNEKADGEAKPAVSPAITPEQLAGKTRDEIRALAAGQGLVPHPTKADKWMDPVTGKERLRLDPGHVDKTTGKPYDDPKAAGPHVHGYEPDGNTKVVDPVDSNPHFPTKDA